MWLLSTPRLQPENTWPQSPREFLLCPFQSLFTYYPQSNEIASLLPRFVELSRRKNEMPVSPQLWYEEWSTRQGYFQNFIMRIVGKWGVTFPIVGIRPLKAVHLKQNAVSGRLDSTRGNRLPTAGRLWNSSSIPAGSLRSRDWGSVFGFHLS